jgi:GNAT superfamily N-acetyltransferase
VIEIRDARPEDAGAIAAINAAAWRTAYRGILDDDRLAGLPVKAWVRDIAANLERLERGSFSLAAERGGEVVGSCFVMGPARDGDLGRDVAELVAIYVDPHRWRQGIGRALLERAFPRTAAAGFSEISLWTFTENRSARAFYEKLGWRPDGTEHPHPIAGVPAIRMRRPLG